MPPVPTPVLGQSAYFYPKAGEPCVLAKVDRIWSDTCVNLVCDDGSKPTSVFVVGVDPLSARPSGYYCELIAQEQAATGDSAQHNDLSAAIERDMQAAQKAAPMETMVQPKVTGYRQLSQAEVALMNEGKALAEQCGAFIAKLRGYPATATDGIPRNHETLGGQPMALPSLDQRWISIGATDLQRGFMAVIRGIAQPTTF